MCANRENWSAEPDPTVAHPAIRQHGRIDSVMAGSLLILSKSKPAVFHQIPAIRSKKTKRLTTTTTTDGKPSHEERKAEKEQQKADKHQEKADRDLEKAESKN